MKIGKKIAMYNQYNHLVAVYNNIKEAEEKSGIPRSTIYSQCFRDSKGVGQYYFRYFKHKDTKQKIEPRKKSNSIVELNMNDEYVKTYKSQVEVAKEKGMSAISINARLKGRVKQTKFKLMYLDDYENLYGKIEETKEEEPVKEETPVKVQHKKKEDYYINILVGLANGTLIDGATYDLNGTKVMYVEKEKALKMGDMVLWTQENLFKKCSIELPMLLPKEKKFLSNLLKAFTNVKGIMKWQDRRDGFEYIIIKTNSLEDDITLPSFVEGKYYQSLQKDTLYSIESLGL